MSRSMDLSHRRPFTPLVNAEDVEAKLHSIVRKHWKDMQKYCRNLDPDNTGEISQSEFRGKLPLNFFPYKFKSNILFVSCWIKYQ